MMVCLKDIGNLTSPIIQSLDYIHTSSLPFQLNSCGHEYDHNCNQLLLEHHGGPHIYIVVCTFNTMQKRNTQTLGSMYHMQ